MVHKIPGAGRFGVYSESDGEESAEVLRLRATSAVARDKSVRPRSGRLCGGLMNNFRIKLALLGPAWGGIGRSVSEVNPDAETSDYW